MLGYFTCTRNRVPSAHMQSLYLSRPSSKYTSPAELGMRVALNMTDPFRTMLFSCKEKSVIYPNLHVNLYLLQLCSCKNLQNLYCKRIIVGSFVKKWENMRHTSSHINRTPAVFHTYSPELDASSHFELYSSAHDVDALISTNDGLAISFNV